MVRSVTGNCPDALEGSARKIAYLNTALVSEKWYKPPGLDSIRTHGLSNKCIHISRFQTRFPWAPWLMGPMGPMDTMGPMSPIGPMCVMGPIRPMGPRGPRGPHGPHCPHGPHGPHGSHVHHRPHGPMGPHGPYGTHGAHGGFQKNAGQNGVFQTAFTKMVGGKIANKKQMVKKWSGENGLPKPNGQKMVCLKTGQAIFRKWSVAMRISKNCQKMPK